jgi:competence protein ComQ
LESRVAAEFKIILDHYYPLSTVNKLAQAFMQDKENERTIWSELTSYMHFMLGGSNSLIYRLAAITEMVILALDIMDDLQDKDNPDKIWMKEPQDQVLNVMLGMLMAAIAELGAMAEQYPEFPLPSSSELSKLVSVAINGQQMDVTMSLETEEQYVQMVQQKSCTLIRLAFYMGVAALPKNQLDQESIDQIYLLADFIGLMAQIQNDVSDLLRPDSKNDLFTKKRTLPVLYFLSQPQNEYSYLRQYYEGTLPFEELYKQWQLCLDYIQNSGCIGYSQMIIQLQLGRAQELFVKIPAISPWKEKFLAITLDMYNEKKALEY